MNADSIPETRPLKMAVIGVGHLGRHHARVVSELEGATLSAIVDVDLDRAKKLANDYGSDALDDFRALGSDIDAVSIVVPTRYHAEVAEHFLNQGCSVLLEKPMTRTLEEARHLKSLADQTGTFLQIGHIERFNPVFEAIRDLSIEPRFVEAHRLAPFSFRSTDIGVVMDLMIHDIDLLLQMVNYRDVVRIDPVGGSLLSAQEDIVNVRVEFEGGCVANLTASRVSLKRMRRMRVFATDSFISLDFDQKYGFVAKKAKDFDQKRTELTHLDAAELGQKAPELFKDFIEMRQLTLDDDEPLKLELSSFVEAVRKGAEPVVSSDHGLKAMELAVRIQESVAERGW